MSHHLSTHETNVPIPAVVRNEAGIKVAFQKSEVLGL